VPTTFNKNEVEVLEKLKKVSTSKDYVITWWDYGYPIWYYANVNTLIDGGKHNEDNFLVSKILITDNQKLAANLSKISIKKYIETNRTVAPQLFTKNGKVIDVSNYLDKIGTENLNIKLDRNVYLMLPYRMFNILPTIAYFSNRDLNNGNVYRSHFLYQGDIRKKGKYILIGQITLDLYKGILILGKNRIPVKTISIVGYSKNAKLIKKIQKIHQNGLNLILMNSYGTGIIVDDHYYNSTFIQMFVFENYDKNLFEPVILNPMIKIYKLK
jgi:undecaprenyl-diphosphooligosaccharide--protein glycosyltransferase